VEWKQAVFIDEIRLTSFAGGRLGNEFVWAPNRSQVPILGRIKTGSSITLCAAVCYYGKTPLHFIYDNVDASTYIRILEQTIIPAANDIYQDQDWLLVQDSAPYHTASTVYQWLDNHAINYISKHSWPPNSPHLNIIENVWARICNQIATSKVRTLKGLKKIVSEVWENIDQSYIQSLVLSMHNRLTEVIDKHGGSTHY
jgi:DDE superfamily endonuclease